MKNRLISAVAAALAVLALSAPRAQQPAAAPEYGPARGTLVIVGGGRLEGTGIVEKFIELAGGAEKNFIIVPTAGGNRKQDGTLQDYKEGDLGIGLSEGTAIVVRQDTFEVMGKWKVAVHDNARLYQPWEKPYDVLSAGDVSNMKTRRIERLGLGR